MPIPRSLRCLQNHEQPLRGPCPQCRKERERDRRHRRREERKAALIAAGKYRPPGRPRSCPCVTAGLDVSERTSRGECARCHRERKATRVRDKRAALAVTKVERGCLECGATDDLHFHHRAPAEKVAEVSKLVTRWSSSRLWAEVAKCDVLCSRCHRESHSGLTPRRLSRDPPPAGRGSALQAIAARFGVSTTCIAGIARGNTWTWVPDEANTVIEFAAGGQPPPALPLAA